MYQIIFLSLTFLFAGCLQTDNNHTLQPENPAHPLAKISDGAHDNGNEHFYFLPPLVNAPAASGISDSTASPVVEICVVNGTECDAGLPLVAEFTTTSGSGSEIVRYSGTDEQYIVNWHTDQFDLDAENTYRISVFAGNQLLGLIDVSVVNNGKELKSVNTDEYIGLKDGRTLPVKFRIEEGAVQVLDPRLIAYWDFNEGTGTSLDNKIDDDHTGVISGGAWNPGIEGSSLYFDGSSHVQIPVTSTLRVDDYTFSLWFKSGDNNAAYPIFEFAQQGQPRTGFHTWINTSGFSTINPRQVQVNMGWFSNNWTITTTAPEAYTLNTWQHLVLTYTQATKTMTLFINGSQITQNSFGSQSGDMPDIQDFLWLGWRPDWSPEGLADRHLLDAQIDEFKIFNAVLSPAEISDLYQELAP